MADHDRQERLEGLRIQLAGLSEDNPRHALVADEIASEEAAISEEARADVAHRIAELEEEAAELEATTVEAPEHAVQGKPRARKARA